MTTENSSNKKDDDDKELPVAGSFFNVVPPKSDKAPDPNEEALMDAANEISGVSFDGDDVEMFKEIIQKTKLSRSGGGKGFSKTTTTSEHVSISNIQTTSTDASGRQQSFVGIGKPLNDVQNPEYDENGYTLYADETTGEKKRVFEALVEYPSVFKMKIVGQDDENETFAPEIVRVVAESCGVELSMVKHTMRKNGKWTSVTVHAPVKSADMLYSLYENVDKNPRVKFKF
jgi:putative lipoic acid-binding regulatory protein